MSRVTWDEQDCLEMPLLASEKIERLNAENKALKESNKELLEAVSQSEIIFRNYRHKDEAKIFKFVIRKAKALRAIGNQKCGRMV